MKGTCVGIAHKVGSFVDRQTGETKDYDNFIFFINFQADTDMIGGLACKQYKLRASHLVEACEDINGMNIKSADDLKQLVGKRLKITADKYDIIEDILICNK